MVRKTIHQVGCQFLVLIGRTWFINVPTIAADFLLFPTVVNLKLHVVNLHVLGVNIHACGNYKSVIFCNLSKDTI